MTSPYYMTLPEEMETSFIAQNIADFSWVKIFTHVHFLQNVLPNLGRIVEAFLIGLQVCGDY